MIKILGSDSQSMFIICFNQRFVSKLIIAGYYHKSDNPVFHIWQPCWFITSLCISILYAIVKNMKFVPILSFLILFGTKWYKKLQIWQHCTQNLATLLFWECWKCNHRIPCALKYGNTCQSRFSRSIRSKVITDSLSKYENNG